MRAATAKRLISTKRERERFDARIEKFDLEAAIHDWRGLTNELMQPLFGNGAVAGGIDIEAVRGARRLAVDRHAKAYRVLATRRSHDQVKVTRVELIRDSAVGTIRNRRLPADRPFTVERPLIQGKARRRRVHAAAILLDAAARGEVLCPFVADVVFR